MANYSEEWCPPSSVPLQFRSTPDVRRPTVMVRFCFDRDGADRCADWVPYCRSERFYAYMRSYCTRSCGFC
ncbi:shTK domain protein [Necator americanus]|uniref:ShTK domain protein n=1 Tax=Necator americanus TaxID=51031 RepID=W2TKS7_NECAM|nr:shTK domain protein [Necator americanus]ETN81627.1 shTK domain protein [Necator americanus]